VCSSVCSRHGFILSPTYQFFQEIKKEKLFSFETGADQGLGHGSHAPTNL